MNNMWYANLKKERCEAKRSSVYVLVYEDWQRTYNNVLMKLVQYMNQIFLIFLTVLTLGCQENSNKNFLSSQYELNWDKLSIELESSEKKYKSKYSKSKKKMKACIKKIKKIKQGISPLLKYIDPQTQKKTATFMISQLGIPHCTGPTLNQTLRKIRNYLDIEPKKIAVILPLTSKFKDLSKAIISGLKSYTIERDGKTYLFDDLFIIYDSENNKEKIMKGLAQLIINDEISMIIGGLTKLEAKILSSITRNLSLPLLLIRKDQDIMQKTTHVLQIYPNELDMAKNIAATIEKKGLKKIAILKPDHGRSNALCNLLIKELQERKIKTSETLEYTSGVYKSMNKAIELLAKTNSELRKDEYLRLIKEAKKKAKIAKLNFNEKQIILKAQITVDAVFIPDNYKNVRYLIKLLKYHQVKSLTLIGNHQWRSIDLLSPWDPFLNGSFFADYVGDYKKLPKKITRSLKHDGLFIAPELAAILDFRLIGRQAALIAAQAILTPFLKKRHLMNHLLHNTNDYSNEEKSYHFHPTREIKWPGHMFNISEKKISLLERNHKSNISLKLINSGAIPVPE